MAYQIICKRVIQDKYGFLWIATTDGLNRYDGYNFKIYKNDPGDKNSLPVIILFLSWLIMMEHYGLVQLEVA